MSYEIGLAIYKKLPFDIQFIIDKMVHEEKLWDVLDEMECCGAHLSRIKTTLEMDYYDMGQYDILSLKYGKDDDEFHIITRRKDRIYYSVINFNHYNDNIYQDFINDYDEYEFYDECDFKQSYEYYCDAYMYDDKLSTHRLYNYNKKFFNEKKWMKRLDYLYINGLI
jgi:hypothetical protein